MGQANDGYATHYTNLTRGLICPHQPISTRYLRIQSTACEQKRWPQVLASATSDLLVKAALGQRIVVHDQSERDRETRAMWQGLSWIRYALRRAWWPNNTLRETSRNGMDVTNYWAEQYSRLPDTVLREVRYYRQYVASGMGPEQLRIESCWRSGGQAR